jgi:hypothetical protein
MLALLLQTMRHNCIQSGRKLRKTSPLREHSANLLLSKLCPQGDYRKGIHIIDLWNSFVIWTLQFRSYKKKSLSVLKKIVATSICISCQINSLTEMNSSLYHFLWEVILSKQCCTVLSATGRLKVCLPNLFDAAKATSPLHASKTRSGALTSFRGAMAHLVEH